MISREKEFNRLLNTLDDWIVELDSTCIFAEIFSLYLEKCILNGQELALEIDVAPATISSWKTGKRIPDATQLPKLGISLGLNESENRCLFRALIMTKECKELSAYLHSTKQLSLKSYNTDIVQSVLRSIKQHTEYLDYTFNL